MPYYRIPDQAGLFDPGRFDALLPAAAAEALASAGLSAAEIRSLPIFVGSSAFSVSKSEAQYRELLKSRPDAACALPLAGFQHIAGVLQDSLGIQGDTYAFNTACTAAANALMMAQRMLEMGRYKHALVVGLELANATTLSGFSGLQLIATELKPFDLKRGGIVLGEGIGAVLLSTQGRAGQTRLQAGAANIDTYSVTTANPDGSSIAALQQGLLQRAGLLPEKIRGIKAHGTASPMNDTGEALGMRRTFSALPPICALKPYIGHTLGACGVNELVLFAAALQLGRFPATLGFETQDPALKIHPSPVVGEAPAGHYLLNYFGFGGHNTALLLEQGA
jgi:3-oxoacyl-[acyl-carrier-protein] synthase-1